MTVPNTPLQASQADGPSLDRDIFTVLKHGIYMLRKRLGTRGLVVLGAGVIGAGVALNWRWLIAIGGAPLLLAALPCIAMCALGLCMMPKGGKPRKPGGADDAHLKRRAGE
jgi:hypothetical protein